MTKASFALPRPPVVSSGSQDRPRPLSSPGALPAPYFATPIPEALQHRRILLLSYHFAPSPAAGALRWQKLAGLLAEQGWGLDVITLHPDQLKRQEPERYLELPAGIRVFGIREDRLLIERLEHRAWRIYDSLKSCGTESLPATAPKTPSSTSTLAPSFRREELAWRLWHPSGWRRAYYAWMRFAHDRAWARRMASLGCALAQPGTHRFIVTCGPPHLVHEAGRLIASATGLPLVVDMRDPWSLERRFQDFAASRLYLHLATRAEREIVGRASLVVMNTPPAAETMARTYPRKRIISVLNGYDEDPLPPSPPRTRFLIAYSGSIYLDRDPRLAFRAAARVVRELELTPAEFGFEFVGSGGRYGGGSLEDLAAQEGLAGYVQAFPERPRAEAMAFLARACVLLSLPQDSTLSIPSKIYEYMRFPAWMLVLTDGGSATDRVLAGTDADVLRPDDVDGMTVVLRRRWEAFAAGERPAPIARHPHLSRRHQARVLMDALAESAQGPGSNVSVTAMPGPRPRAWRIALRWLSGILLLTLIFGRVDVTGIAAVPAQSLAAGVAAAGALLIVAQALSTARWRLILGPGAPRWSYLFRLYLISSFASLFLPTSIGGDAFRIAALTRRVTPGSAIASVVLDRMFGTLALGVFLLVGVATAGWAWTAVRGAFTLRSPTLAPFGILLIVALLSAIMIWLLRQRLSALHRLWGETGSLSRRLVGSPGALFAVFGTSLAVQGTYIATWMALGHIMGLALPLGTYLVAVPVVSLAAMLPVTLSGLGVREGTWLLLLSHSGSPAASVVAFSLLYFLGNIVLGAVGGVAFVWKGTDSHGTDASG